VIVISLGTPRSAGENFEWTLEHLRVRATSLGAPTTSLRAPTTSLGAPRVTVEQCGKNILLGMLQVHLEIIAITYRSRIVKSHVFRLYCRLGIYVSV
jgi:hypothetical protein